MSKDDNDNNKATITRLVNDGAADGSNKDLLFNHAQDSESANAIAKDDGADIKAVLNENTSDNLLNRNGQAGFSKQSVQVLKRLSDAHMLVPGSGLGPSYFDEYRRIKRPLLSNAFGKSSSLVDRGNLILITSSLAGEGKTNSAVNLALSIAHERDHTVMLVDCDVIKQGASRMLGVENTPGLVDLLEHDRYTVGDFMLSTDINNFTVLPAGTQAEYVTELLASQRMSSIVDEIASRYDDRVIIFDGPPLLQTTQSQILLSLVGQTVFVIETAKTPHDVVKEALGMIPEEKAIGLVMNKNEGTSDLGGYYYGYYGEEDDKNN